MRNVTGKFTPKRPEKVAGALSNDLQKKAPRESLSTDQLRADFFGRSEITPEFTLFSHPSAQRTIVLIFVLLALMGSSWFCFLGPGASLLETSLNRLAQNASTPTNSTEIGRAHV